MAKTIKAFLFTSPSLVGPRPHFMAARIQVATRRTRPPTK
jgi:hypothetical protein